MSNPNIAEEAGKWREKTSNWKEILSKISKERSTGAKTSVGKLKVSLNAIKYKNKASRTKVINDLELRGYIKGVDVTLSKNVRLKEEFIAWLKSKTSKELTELARLNEIIRILDIDITRRVMPKIKKEIPINRSDVKLIRLFVDSLNKSYKLKSGDKHVDLNAQFRDIRDLLFRDKR